MNNENIRHQRILIIDDNPSIHDDFRKILVSISDREVAFSKAGAALFDEPMDHTKCLEFQIDCATQGEGGLALVRHAEAENCPYSMAFVDVRMPPGLDGIETTSRIWEIAPAMQIVICTAFSDYSWDEMVARLPKSDQLLFLKKPFDAVEVLQMAHALTEKWRLQEAVRFKLEILELNVDARTKVLEAANAKLQVEIKTLTTALRENESRHLAGKV